MTPFKLIYKTNNLILFILLLSISKTQTFIPYKELNKQTLNKIQNESNQTPNLLSMNHSISFINTIINGTSYTKGIYSNYSNYNFSKNVSIKTGIHFIQNNNPNKLLSNYDLNFIYDLNFEYKISQNSIFKIQLTNFNNYNSFLYE